jgi:type VI protein secretion system component VasF
MRSHGSTVLHTLPGKRSSNLYGVYLGFIVFVLVAGLLGLAWNLTNRSSDTVANSVDLKEKEVIIVLGGGLTR